jgi:subtilase family serine protease
MVIKMSNENGRPWYKRPTIMVPIMVAIIGAVGVIIVAYIGIIPFMGDERATVTVQGIVTDNDGKPVVGASVEIDGSSATTGSGGGYVIRGVPINTKTITVRALGGEVVTQQALRISEGAEIIRHDVNLPLSVTPISPTPTPDLFVSEFSLDPGTPIQGDPVSVRVGVYNQGNDRSGAFTVQWWAGENFKEPACTWQVDSLAAQGWKILTCTYDGYTSWYGSLTTKVVVDSSEEVAESNEENNEDRKTISVSRDLTTKVVVDSSEEVAESKEENNEDRKTTSVGRESTTTTPLIPDLFVNEFSLNPETPIQGDPVSVRVGVYNQGTDRSGAFTVQWWAGENFKEPACTWQVDSLAARGGRILTCPYDGYRSWYSRLTTKVVVDSSEEVAESNEENNEDRKTIVVKPSGVHIVFDALPDGTPISSDLILTGDEFLSKGIRLEGAPEGTYCSDAVAAIRCSGTYRTNFNFLTTSRPDNVKSCNTVPVAIIFEKQVHHVTLTFAGASTTYTMKAYDSAGNLLGTVEQDALLDGGTFEVTFSSKSESIGRVTFGRAAAVTAIKEIYYER